MHLRIGVERMPDEERRLLQPGELPLAYERASQLAGYSGIGREAKPRMKLRFDPDPLNGGLSTNDGWLEAKLGGVNAAGAAGSLGDLFSKALDTSLARVVVTDRRLLVLADEGKVRSTPVAVRFAVERSGVTDMARSPRVLQRGRVRVSFADDSWAMAMSGLFLKGAADRLVAAFHRR